MFGTIDHPEDFELATAFAKKIDDDRLEPWTPGLTDTDGIPLATDYESAQAGTNV